MDIFQQISGLEEVEIVRNLYPEVAGMPLDLIFFTCPQMQGSRRRNRIRVNELRTGLTTAYEEGISENSITRLEKAIKFAQKLTDTGIEVGRTTNVFGTADALILFNPPVDPPAIPQIEGVWTTGNYEIVLRHFGLWAELYRQKPWLNCPSWARKMEEERLRELLPTTVPKNLAEDFICRVFAGFSLDGILIRRGEFGIQNPVIFGVESAGVAVLQNAALPRDRWLPVIQLRS